MKLLGAFLKLIRYPNLVFIALAQLLFFYCIILPISWKYPGATMAMEEISLLTLIFASVFIAAAGYIINDYFDLNIDKINKPGRLVIEKVIKRRWAIMWHILLSLAGLALSFYLGWRIQNLLPAMFNALAIFLLWFYSTTFKKQLLIGNIIISLLTAWVVLVMYVCEIKLNILSLEPDQRVFIAGIFKPTVLYGGFAFILSIIREAVKDMEDFEGDARYHCNTMPIAWGFRATKVYTAVWSIVLAASLLILVIYALQVQWWWLAAYLVIAVLAPLLNILRKLKSAGISKDYRAISSLVKLVMLTGILSMFFFKWYI